jgi:hypothetical protein
MSPSLDELIERLEKLEGPDRELDAEIAVAVQRPRAGWLYTATRLSEFGTRDDGFPFPDNWFVLIERTDCPGVGHQYFRPPAYTASLDAAMTLLPAGWYGCLDGIGSHCTSARFGPPTDGEECGADHASPAIALCIASLRARSTT